MRAVVGFDAGDGHPVDVRRLRGQPGFVHRVGLEDCERVEEISHARSPLYLGQPEVMVVEQICLLTLESDEGRLQRLRRIEANTNGQGVDEQPDHRLHARKPGRSAGHRCAEHDVVAARGGGEQHAPGGLNESVDGDSQPRTEGSERPRESGGQRYLDRTGTRGDLAIDRGRRQDRRLRCILECTCPRPSRFGVILPRDPGQEHPIRRHTR